MRDKIRNILIENVVPEVKWIGNRASGQSIHVGDDYAF